MTKLAFLLTATIAITAGLGCQEPTKPAGGYIGGNRADRGLDTDTYSPGVPRRSSVGLGTTPGNLPEGENAPAPASVADRPPPPASPAADRAPGSTPPGQIPAERTPPPTPLQR